ncbi:GAF domain-containing protein [Rhodococcus globerulus]|uniref:GAF domain-containing protein n=1 Tax=Rhodococcus globerulus TaxID=33008 RepID=UPI003530CE88
MVLIDDFEIAGPRWHAFAQSAARSGLGACRVFPLRLTERLLGALCCVHDRSVEFSPPG